MRLVGLCSAFFAGNSRFVREVMHFMQHPHIGQKADMSFVQLSTRAGHFSLVHSHHPETVSESDRFWHILS
jgi:hypothetical protein